MAVKSKYQAPNKEVFMKTNNQMLNQMFGCIQEHFVLDYSLADRKYLWNGMEELAILCFMTFQDSNSEKNDFFAVSAY